MSFPALFPLIFKLVEVDHKGQFRLANRYSIVLIYHYETSYFKRFLCFPGTRALDIASRELSQQLDYFVVFSSVACGRGNHGQSNYGLANSAMERICEQRLSDGLPALAIQWGAIGDVGVVASSVEDTSDLVLADTVPQGIASCLTTLGALMTLPHAVTAAMVVVDKRPSQEKPSQELVQVIANIFGT